MEISAIETINKIKKRELKAEEVLNFFLEKIKNEDDKIGAFIEVFEKSARQKAREIDEKIKSGKQIGKLAGAIISIKDNILYKGHKISCASKILNGYISPYNSTVIDKLLKEDAIIIGRTNMDEFAMGSSTENSGIKKTRNPLNLDYVPGGSSGGSAAAVKAGFCHISLGSDTGGSIRQPAAFCGVYGLKPTYGSVSRYGLVAFASSLDQIGPISNNISDLKLIYDVIKGYDYRDSTSKNYNLENQEEISNITAAIPENILDDIEVDLKKYFISFIEKIKNSGIKIINIKMPYIKYALGAYYIISSAQASSNLAKFDGLKYGNFINDNDILNSYKKTRGFGFGPEVKRRILIGTYLLSKGYYDKYYLKAEYVADIIKKEFSEIFRKADLIIMPTTPTAAFKIGEKLDPISIYTSDIFTVPVNLAGICALSIPYGMREKDNMPYGIQLIGDYFCEDKLFKIVQKFI